MFQFLIPGKVKRSTQLGHVLSVLQSAVSPVTGGESRFLLGRTVPFRTCKEDMSSKNGACRDIAAGTVVTLDLPVCLCFRSFC